MEDDASEQPPMASLVGTGSSPAGIAAAGLGSRERPEEEEFARVLGAGATCHMLCPCGHEPLRAPILGVPWRLSSTLPAMPACHPCVRHNLLPVNLLQSCTVKPTPQRRCASMPLSAGCELPRFESWPPRSCSAPPGGRGAGTGTSSNALEVCWRRRAGKLCIPFSALLQKTRMQGHTCIQQEQHPAALTYTALPVAAPPPPLRPSAGTCPSRNRRRSWRGRRPHGSCSGSCMDCRAGEHCWGGCRAADGMRWCILAVGDPAAAQTQCHACALLLSVVVAAQCRAHAAHAPRSSCPQPQGFSGRQRRRLRRRRRVQQDRPTARV